MALTFEEVAFDGSPLRVVKVANNQYIEERMLTDFDKEQLEAALSAGMHNHLMPNTGFTAAYYFAPYLRTVEQLVATYENKRVFSNPENGIWDLVRPEEDGEGEEGNGENGGETEEPTPPEDPETGDNT